MRLDNFLFPHILEDPQGKVYSKEDFMHKKIGSNKVKARDKIFGFMARMAASRFPNKPLKKILGIPMIEHVYERSKLFEDWKIYF